MAAALDMFRCDRRSMTLSRPGCARLWESAQQKRPKEYEGRYACLACPVGAANAGKPVIVTAPATESLRMVCPRCRKPAARLINQRLCVSCYNRHREAQIGRDAKGNRPRLCDILHVERLAVLEGKAERVVRMEQVADAREAMFAIAKCAREPMAFGRRHVMWAALTRSGPRGPWAPQLELGI